MQTFDAWKSQVDGFIAQLSGLHADDIDDWDYWYAYESGQSARNAAQEALENAGWDAGWDADEDLIDEP